MKHPSPTWEEVAPIPVASSFNNDGLVPTGDEKIFAVKSAPCTSDIYLYDIAGDTWSLTGGLAVATVK